MDESEQEPRRGLASCRPCLASQDGRPERPPHVNVYRNRRPFPPQGTNHRSHHHHPDSSFLQKPPLLPNPPPAARIPLYRWAAPDLEGQVSRPHYQEQAGFRYAPPQPTWAPAPGPHEDSWRGRVPPPVPCYLTHYESRSYGGAEEEWGGPRTRLQQHRHTNTHRVNGYDHDW
ncbi:velvet complex subunit 2-like [Echeneis naucrates]|nr:velvet complex subunit 2-like [Echeneis naucrates]